MSSLDTLPHEILVNIFSNLSGDQLSNLGCTCKQMHQLLSPVIWKDIDAHPEWYYDQKKELKAPPPRFSPQQRLRHTRGDSAKLFDALKRGDPEIVRRLIAQTKSLCTVIDPARSVHAWHLLPRFTNLEALELFGTYWFSQEDEETIPEISEPPLPNLRFAKLFGYIPRAVAKWVICRCGPTLERLELGMLDRPISNMLSDTPAFMPVPEDEVHTSGTYGSLVGNNAHISPRPLTRFLLTRSDDANNEGNKEGFELNLPNLKHLYLCRPARGSGDWSPRADERSLKAWQRILQASSKTLETLVLEQRPTAMDFDASMGDSSRYMRTSFYNVLGTELLMRMVEKALRKESFGALKEVYMYGITVGEGIGRPSDHIPGGRLMLLLQARGIKCEARLGNWCRFDHESGLANWIRPDEPSDSEEDDSDDEEVEPKFKWDTVMSSV